jgi:hypothetical protein
MHAYFITRGLNHMTEAWKALLQGQSFKWKRKNLKTGKEETTLIQGALRPILLWEYVFPEESLNEVLFNTVGGVGTEGQFFAEKVFGVAFRAATGAKKPKKLTMKELKDVRHRLMQSPGVGVTCIGIKKDKRRKMPEWGYQQEML